MAKKFTIRKIHRYLSIFIAVQLLLWTVSGIYFAFNKIEMVRGEQYRLPLETLVLTGGSDISILRKTLPTHLDQTLHANSEVHWVKGPLSDNPILPEKRKLKWIFHDSPQQLDELIVDSNYVLTVFGVSFFEVLQYGIPTVVCNHQND